MTTNSQKDLSLFHEAPPHVAKSAGEMTKCKERGVARGLQISECKENGPFPCKV